MSRALFVAAVIVLFAGCGHKLSPEEQQQLALLRASQQAVQQEVASAQQEYDQLSGGLVKALIAMRMEVLKTNEALLTQRVNAIESGAKITVVVTATKDDPIRATQLLAEIEAARAKVEAAKAEADRYSGGLVQAMALMNVATTQNTVAMLEQQYLMAKYGLMLPTAPAAAAAAK